LKKFGNTAPDMEVIMGSQRGSASVTEKQRKKGEEVFKKQARKQRAKSPTTVVGGGSSGGRLGVRGGRGGGGGGGVGGGAGAGGGGGVGPKTPGQPPTVPRRGPQPDTGTGTGPNGPPDPLSGCQHRTCKCQVDLTEKYCNDYCAKAAAHGDTERCRCNHAACR